MRISVWSSDVCSSDLSIRGALPLFPTHQIPSPGRPMKLLIQRLAHEMQGTPGTILVVGAGTGAEIPLWRELASPHLVLVEAHPRQAEELRSEEHTSELQSLMRISYAVFCLKKKTKK